MIYAGNIPLNFAVLLFAKRAEQFHFLGRAKKVKFITSFCNFIRVNSEVDGMS